MFASFLNVLQIVDRNINVHSSSAFNAILVKYHNIVITGVYLNKKTYGRRIIKHTYVYFYEFVL